MTAADRIAGLYAITAADVPGGALASAVAAALRGGARVVQYRDKGLDHERRLAEAGTLARLTRGHGATFIVNDDVELAREVGADGVHLGRGDTALAAARERLGPAALIGVSCYDDIDRALAAASQGADYVAFGSVFPSPTKPDAPRAPLALIREASRRLHVPIVAIGGITLDNAAATMAAGAGALAVVSALFASDEVETAARRLDAAISPSSLRQDREP